MNGLRIVILKRVFLYFFIVLLLPSSRTFAQNLSPHNANIRDSLRNELLRFPSPREKAGILLELSRVYSGDSPDSIRFFAAQAIELGEATGELAAVAGARIMLGHAAERERDVQTAIAQYRLALQSFEKVPDTSQMILSGLLLAEMYSYLLDSAEAYRQLGQALWLANQSGSPENLGEVYFHTSAVARNFGKRKVEKNTLQKALQTFRSIPKKERNRNTDNREANILNNMGFIYINEAKFDSAAEALVASIEMNQQLGNTINLSYQYVNLGFAYRQARDPDKALEYMAKAEKIFEDFGDCYMQANTHYGIAAILQGMENKEAQFEKELHRSIEMFEDCDFKGAKGGRALASLGHHYFETKGDTGKALNLYRRAEQHFAADPQGVDHPDFAQQFALVNIYAKNYDKAEKLLERVAAYLAESPDPVKQQLYLDDSHRLYKAKGDFARSLEFMERLAELKDSVNNKEILARTEEIQVQYDVAAKEREILEQELAKTQLEADLAQKSLNLRSWILGSIVVLLLASWVILLVSRKVRKGKRELEAARQASIAQQKQEEERRVALRKRVKELERQALQAQMNPHFIFNSLTTLQGFIISGRNQDAENYLHQFSRLIRSTLDASRQSAVTLAEELDNLESYLRLEQMRVGENLQFKINVADSLEPELIVVPPMLVQPFVENAILHGIVPKHGPGSVRVDFTGHENMLQVSIQDDGIGRKKRGSQQKRGDIAFQSLGTQITRERLELIWGDREEHLSVVDLWSTHEKSEGTLVKLSIPIPS